MTDQQTMDRPAEETITEAVRQGRQSIDVIPGQGLSPDQMAKMIDVAMTMAKARHSIPDFLKGNPGDCFAIVNMAIRNGLNPYMVAQYTYVQNNRLCLMSILYHSLAQSSGYLVEPLREEYEGEGDDLVCVVTGRVRGQPLPYVTKSQPLKALHPGHTTKDGKQFAKGSPLWDKDPKMQLFYHTARNWVRKYTPLAILGGIVGEDEIDDYIEHEPSPGLIERLSNPDRPQTGEGFRDGAHLNAELARIAPNETEEVEESEPVIDRDTRETPEAARKRIARSIKAHTSTKKAKAKKPHQRAPQAAPEPKPKPGKFGRRQPEPPTAKTVKAAADRAEKPPAPKPAKRLPWFEYVEVTEQWIKTAADQDKAEERWDSEKDYRDQIAVPIAERIRLRGLLDEKF